MADHNELGREGEDEALIGAIVDDLCGVIRAAAA